VLIIRGYIQFTVVLSDGFAYYPGQLPLLEQELADAGVIGSPEAVFQITEFLAGVGLFPDALVFLGE